MTDGYDLAIRGGTVVTASDIFRADVGIRGGRIAAIGETLSGRETIEADGLLVMPGGVETHCHHGQLPAALGEHGRPVPGSIV